jgi:hypothetical protein
MVYICFEFKLPEETHTQTLNAYVLRVRRILKGKVEREMQM